MTSLHLSSGAPEQIALVVYHEAGHAVMAHLFGRAIHSIYLLRNIEDSYNGHVNWGVDDLRRKWDPSVPYNRLGLKEGAESPDVERLVAAAGKAAERLRYRRLGLKEVDASFGTADEQALEHALRRLHSVPDETLSKAKQITEDLATEILGDEACWAAIEALAQDLLQEAQTFPDVIHRDEEHVDTLLAKSFKATASPSVP